MILGLFLILIIVCIVIFTLCKNASVLADVVPSNRGENSERKAVRELLNMGIDSRAIFHDCYIRKFDGSYTQVDLVVALSQGLLVFEIKDYSGWIFGHHRQKYWTQVLAYGKERHRFYNPILQNSGHIKAIRDNLPNNPHIPIYSIIVFYGKCTLKNITVTYENDYIIYSDQIRQTVKSIKSRPVANFGDKYEIMNVLRQAVSNGCNPGIVAAQMMTATKAKTNCPKSTYNYSYKPLAGLRRYTRFRRF